MTSCHPAIAPNQPQFIIGYGSLMNAASKQETVPDSSDSIPIRVRGFERGWFYQSQDSDFEPIDSELTTYLGVVENPAATINAVLFRLLGHPQADIDKLDEREHGYCRQQVHPAQIIRLDRSPIPLAGEIWIYVVKSIHPPSASHPIVQSYVDLTLNGCLELETAYRLNTNHRHDFTAEYIQTTSHWSSHWLDDRQSPRRPSSQLLPFATIDQLLSIVTPTHQYWQMRCPDEETNLVPQPVPGNISKIWVGSTNIST